MGKTVDVIDLLLRPDTPDVQKQRPTSQVKLLRLSEAFGEPVVFSLRALSYNAVQDLQNASDFDVQLVLEGVTAPNLRDPRLLERFQCATPADVVKAMLLPGEISELFRAIERLSGYRRTMLEEVKKIKRT